MDHKLSAPDHLVGIMNDTKWEELRVAMHGLGRLHPQFQIKDLNSNNPTHWDGEWFYHFRLLPYSVIEWCELRVRNEEQHRAVLQCIRAIHLPGHKTPDGFRILGWVKPGEIVDYIK
jgi:hypothetical protein